MTVKSRILLILMLPLCLCVYGQMDTYSYKRELTGIQSSWHKLILPEVIYSRLNQDLSDIRIYALSSANDTIEVPYVLQSLKEQLIIQDITFDLINASFNEKGYYFTFKVGIDEDINQFLLDFKQQNFDWRIDLEGSQNQMEWYTILKDYRVLSIVNSETNYQFTELNFQDVNYKYLRLLIKSKVKPELLKAKIVLHKTSAGSYHRYNLKKFKSSQNKKNQSTTLDIDLNSPVPVSRLKIQVKNNIDYYRPITIDYLADSIETEKGWVYKYKRLTNGILNSIEDNQFSFKSQVLNKLKLNISNYDNEPLEFENVIIKGFQHQLVFRLTEPGRYFLAYGNKNAYKPVYDIHNFSSKIPKDLTSVAFGKEEVIDKIKPKENHAIFKNKNWLWAVMIVIIAILGWFSLQMIRSK